MHAFIYLYGEMVYIMLDDISLTGQACTCYNSVTVTVLNESKLLFWGLVGSAITGCILRE